MLNSSASSSIQVQDWYSHLVDVDFHAMSIREEHTERFVKRTNAIVESLLKSDVLPFSRMQRLVDITVLSFPTPTRQCFKASAIFTSHSPSVLG